MIDLPAVLERLYPDVPGIQTVDNEITNFPKDLQLPTKEQVEKAWEEIKVEREYEQIRLERRRRYEQETDHLFFDALAKMDAPELKEWQDARKTIKSEIPKDKRK